MLVLQTVKPQQRLLVSEKSLPIYTEGKNHHQATICSELTHTISDILIFNLTLGLVPNMDKAKIRFCSYMKCLTNHSSKLSVKRVSSSSHTNCFSGCIFTGMGQIRVIRLLQTCKGTNIFPVYRHNFITQEYLTQFFPRCLKADISKLLSISFLYRKIQSKILFIPNPWPKNLCVAYSCTNMMSIPLS
jgi:hypothetical protein